MLHPSLRELEDLARHCTSLAQATGILVETQELLRNAVEHSTDEAELIAWYSRVICGVFDSPACAARPSSRRIIPAGALARLELLPGSPLGWSQWLDDESVAADPSFSQRFEAMIQAGHLSPVEAQRIPGADLCAHLDAVLSGDDAQKAADLVDQLAFLAAYRPGIAQNLPAHASGLLFRLVLEARPPVVRTHQGLPDTAQRVHVEDDLVEPVAAIARWAASLAGCPVRGTLARLSSAAQRGVLHVDEAEELERIWRTGVRIRLQRWVERVADHPATLVHLPATQRSAYGAAARSLAACIDALRSRTSAISSDG